MEIAKYNDMMAHLTRKGLATGTEEPQKAPPPKPDKDPFETFKEQSDLFLQASFATTSKDYFNGLIEKEYQKAREAGVSAEDALGFLRERSQMYRKLIDEGRRQGEPAKLGPSYGRENLAESIEPKVKKFKELVKKGDSITDAKNKVIKLFKLKRSKTAGTPTWMTEGKKQLVSEGILEDKDRGKVKIIGETQDFSKDKNIKRIDRETFEPNIKKITYKNLNTGKTFVKYKPLLRGNTVTVSGAGYDSLEKARKVVADYNKSNPPKVAVTLKLEEDLRKLANDSRLAPLLKTGTPDNKYLKTVQEILDLNVSQAEDKLKQLGEAVKPGGNLDVPGIDKISKKKADNITNFYKSKAVSKAVVDKAIGESVGEKSLKTTRQDIQRQFPFKGGIKTFETDEAKAKMSGFRLGSKPYSIFGQVIDGRLNQGEKMAVDSQLSTLEESVQKALKGQLFDKKGNKIPPRVAIKKYNDAAAAAEKKFNSQKMRNFKSVRIPRISLKSPDKTILNKAAYKKYKQYFDNNYKQLGYSFEIPKDLDPIPEIAAKLKNTNSPEYKNLIKNVKEVGKKFIKDIDKYDEKDLLKIFDNPKFQQFKKFIPRLVSTDDFSERRYASANNIMSDATYVDDEEQTFAERNPITTGVGLTVPSAVAVQKAAGVPILKALTNIGKYPLKALGSLPGAAYFAGDTIQKNLAEGKSIPDAVIDKEVGIELLLPEAVKRFGPLMMKAARVSTPIGATITAAGLAKDAYQRAQELKAMSPAQRAELARIRDDFSFGEYSGAKDGGLMRQGFAEGPKDPGRRTFMKIMGGLASLPILGRFFEVGEKATPVAKKFFTEVQQLTDTSTQMPSWFPSFLNKFRKEGKAENVFEQKKVEVSKAEYDLAVSEGKAQKYYTDVARTDEYKASTPDHMDYFKLEDTDKVLYTKYTNEKVPGVRVDDVDGQIDVVFENDYSQPVIINYTSPGAKGPDVGRPDMVMEGIAKQETKPKGDFSAVDQEVYATDPDGGFEAQEYVADTLDDMMEGQTRMMEEYATGKKTKLSRGEGRVIEAEIRAEQAAESAAEAAEDFD
tara:strand:- start:398 stop:3586 length:3189 start_codon:yes stop_codon:yes gene_type:complete